MVDVVVVDIPATKVVVADLYIFTELCNTILGVEVPVEQGQRARDVDKDGETKGEDVVEQEVQDYSVPVEEEPQWIRTRTTTTCTLPEMVDVTEKVVLFGILMGSSSAVAEEEEELMAI
jgi:hypothetical protein